MMAKTNCPRHLMDEEDRFFWRWNRIWYTEEDNEYVDTPCWIVDRETSECGVSIKTDQRGNRRFTYKTRMIDGKDSIVYLARAVLKYVNGPDISLLKMDGEEPVDCGHLCDNPFCINPGHLVVQTPGENAQQSVSHGNRRAQKLSPEDVLEIRKLLKESDMTQREIADMFNVGRPLVSQIKLGKRWSHI